MVRALPPAPSSKQEYHSDYDYDAEQAARPDVKASVATVAASDDAGRLCEREHDRDK